MILLEPITTAQSVSMLTNVQREDLPIVAASFEFLDGYSGQTFSTTADIVASGFKQSADIALLLQGNRQYQLTVKNGDVTILRDIVFVSDQIETEGTNEERIESVVSYTLDNNQFVSFNALSGETTKNQLINFNNVR